MSAPLAPNLSWREVLAGGGYDLDDLPEELRTAMERTALEVFQVLRDALGVPLLVVPGGGLRTPELNRKVGGALPRTDPDSGAVVPGTGSQHLFGTALDLKARDPADTVRLFDLAATLQGKPDGLPLGGCAIYVTPAGRPRFCHVDRRGRRARWNHGHRQRVKL